MRAAGVAVGASAASARSMDGDSSTNNNNKNNNNIASPAVVVEDDDDDEDGGDDFDFMVPIDREESYPPTRPLSQIHPATSRTSTTSSSLSDDRSQNALTMDAVSFRNLPPTHPHPTTAGTPMNAAMIRNDSRLSNDSSTMLRSAENSSGNYWGWFEDVHVGPESSSTMGDPRRNTTRRERSRGGPLSNEGSMSPAGDSGIDLGSGEKHAHTIHKAIYTIDQASGERERGKRRRTRDLGDPQHCWYLLTRGLASINRCIAPWTNLPTSPAGWDDRPVSRWKSNVCDPLAHCPLIWRQPTAGPGGNCWRQLQSPLQLVTSHDSRQTLFSGCEKMARHTFAHFFSHSFSLGISFLVPKSTTTMVCCCRSCCCWIPLSLS